MAASRVKNSAITFHLTTFIPTSPKHDPAMSSTPIQPDGLTPSGVPIIQTQRHPLPRRRFLATMGASAAVIALGGCTGDPQPHLLDRNENMAATPRPAGDTVPFIEPQALRSANGSLEVTLVALPATIADAEQTLYGYTYNQTSPGPTLRIRPGDQLIVHLENQLPEDTNLHTHGLHVSPEGNADNVFARVRPGETRTYTYNIPQDHRGGLFWYHPHAHGTVAKQVAAGLAGAIVIEDDTDAVTEIADSTERILIMSDPPAVSTEAGLSATPMEQMIGRQGSGVLVNGVGQPHITANGGDRERWRIVNASSSRYYQLAIEDHPLWVIASDGGRLSKPQEAAQVLLAPGERTEVLVLPSTSGSYALRALEYDRGDVGMGGMMGGSSSVSPEVTVAMLDVMNSAPVTAPPGTIAMPDLQPLEPTATRTLELGMGMGAMMGGSVMSFTIDGREFAADRTDIAVKLGAVERWVITNSTTMDHPFHLHVWPFVVEGVEDEMGWKDTVNVPAQDSVTIVVPFVGVTGRTVYHCHILDHEDLGMMGVIEVSA